jgi:hypothetical protein
VGGDTQQLVLAFFANEDAADEAAMALKKWEKASEYMKVDAIGMLAKDEGGKVKQHKQCLSFSLLPADLRGPSQPSGVTPRPRRCRAQSRRRGGWSE